MQSETGYAFKGWSIFQVLCSFLFLLSIHLSVYARDPYVC